MSQEVTTAFVKQYTDGVRLLQQQMGSRFKEAVLVEDDIEGDRSFHDQMDATAMNEVTNRHGDTEYTDTPHRRRMVTLKTYEVADLVDRADQRRLLNNPINGYTRSMAAAANRRCDDIIISSALATAATGVDGSGTAAYDTDFQVAVGTSNLTVAKLTSARELLEAAENEEDDDMYSWHLATNASGRQGLLSEDPTAGASVVNADYATIKALVNGQINTFLGFSFIKSERLAGGGTATQDTLAWVKASLLIAISQDPRGFIDVLPQKRHSTQVRYEMDAGATRMDEKGVVQIICKQD